jgi:putative signal transducing protein
MKLIFSSTDLVVVNELKDILDGAGIPCFINNENAPQLAGGVPMAEAMPELWIDDDSREAEALQIKKDWLSPQPQGTAWTCPKCGEQSESQFTSCWKCGTKKP